MLNQNILRIRGNVILSKGIGPAMLAVAMAVTSHGAWAADGDPAVKKSGSGICHDASSRHFSRLKDFKAYPSMQACLEDGGRKPKR